jgi:uncharacterized protein with HEPN domain
MVPRSLRIRLTDIREEITGIRELTKDADADRFAASWAMMRAVQHALLIIAEAAKHIPPELKNTRPEVRGKRLTASAICCGMNTAASTPPFYGRS